MSWAGISTSRDAWSARNRVAGIALLAGIAVSSAPAQGSLDKWAESTSIAVPSTLGLEGKLASADPQAAASERGACAATVVDVPGLGPRLATARHCAAKGVEVFDEHHALKATGRVSAPGDIDVGLLDVDGPLPWAGLEPRPLRTLTPGERLCAFRVEHAWRGGKDAELLPAQGITRERICARFLRTSDRAGSPPLLVMSHPYPHGTSGSALLDRQGRVVGIVVATTTEIGLAEPIASLIAIAKGQPPTTTEEALFRAH